METAFYTRMSLYSGVEEHHVIKRAHTLGYELVKFAGWSDTDIGPSGMPGPRRGDATANRKKLSIISKSFDRDNDDGTYDCIVISQSERC